MAVLLCACAATISEEKEMSAMRTLTGRYAYIPSPCTTTPCLPGMVYAITSEGTAYVLTAGGRWFADNRAWNGYTPHPGDGVSVTGEVSSRKDVRNETFFVIEVTTLVPAQP